LMRWGGGGFVLEHHRHLWAAGFAAQRASPIDSEWEGLIRKVAAISHRGSGSSAGCTIGDRSTTAGPVEGVCGLREVTKWLFGRVIANAAPLRSPRAKGVKMKYNRPASTARDAPRPYAMTTSSMMAQTGGLPAKRTEQQTTHSAGAPAPGTRGAAQMQRRRQRYSFHVIIANASAPSGDAPTIASVISFRVAIPPEA